MVDFKKYKKDIREDYDKGYSLETIAERCINKDFTEKETKDKKISKRTAYKEVCKVVYEYVMERGYI